MYAYRHINTYIHRKNPVLALWWDTDGGLQKVALLCLLCSRLVCMFICVLCVCVYTYVCTKSYAWRFTESSAIVSAMFTAGMYVCLYVCMYCVCYGYGWYVHSCMYIYMYIYIYIYMNIYIYIYIYICICMYVYIYIYIVP